MAQPVPADLAPDPRFLFAGTASAAAGGDSTDSSSAPASTLRYSSEACTFALARLERKLAQMLVGMEVARGVQAEIGAAQQLIHGAAPNGLVELVHGGAVAAGLQHAHLFAREAGGHQRAVRGHDELHARQRLGQRGQHDPLPLRMQVQVDLIHQHDALGFVQALARCRAQADVVEQVGDPADEGAVTVGQRTERHLVPLHLEQEVEAGFRFLRLGQKAAFLGQQLVDQRGDLLGPARVALLVGRQPERQRHQRRALLEQAGHALVARPTALAAGAHVHRARSLDASRGAIAEHKELRQAALEQGIPEYQRQVLLSPVQR
jgi:hypothetical protein